MSVYSGNACLGFVSPSEDLPCPLPTRGREVSTNYITGMLKRALSGPGQKETSSFPTEEPGPGGSFFFPLFPLHFQADAGGLFSLLHFRRPFSEARVTCCFVSWLFIPEPLLYLRERRTGYKKESFLLITLKLRSDWPEGREPRRCGVCESRGRKSLRPCRWPRCLLQTASELPSVAFN